MLTENVNLQDHPTAFKTAFKVGILSDTHGVIDAGVKHALQSCEIILHAGDVCGQVVLDELTRDGARVIAVGGNNDGQFPYTGDQLPDVAHITLPSGKITLLHGHQFGMDQPDHEQMRLAFADSRVIVYGHTHRQLHEMAARPWLLNPGAAGETRTRGGAACALIDISNERWDVSLQRP